MLTSKIMNQKNIFATHLKTPLGTMIALAHDAGLCLLQFTDKPHLETEIQSIFNTLQATTQDGQNSVLELLQKELTAYFTGTLQTFSVPLAPIGTPFQTMVWQVLLKVPYAHTKSYLEQASLLNNPRAYRAIGLANSKNHIAIVIPCHRIIAHNGKLSGYASGTDRKKWLLEHESNHR